MILQSPMTDILIFYCEIDANRGNIFIRTLDDIASIRFFNILSIFIIRIDMIAKYEALRPHCLANGAKPFSVSPPVFGVIFVCHVKSCDFLSYSYSAYHTFFRVT